MTTTAPVRRRRNSGLQAVRAIVGGIITFLFLAPILWMVTTAFKTGNQAFSSEIQWFFTPTLKNFEQVIGGTGFTYALINSLQVSIISSVVALLLASGIAYPIARFDFKGKSQLAGTILSLRIIPPIVTIIPLFLVMRTIGLNGSLLSIIILHIFMNLPLAVWLLRGFYEDVPKELEEAAQIDGLGHLSTFFRIVLPLAAPGVAATGLLCFVFSWNEFLFANILSNASSQTVTVALTQYVTPVGTQWTQIMAAGTLVAVPVWIAALAAQKYLVRGLTLGAVK
ncbi:carbohydrate ABC transporter permease [Microbacterium oxydans]|uniref:carbohydrate ABC transporter permease n=1 Tax=Microbacterium oxydans TaxID=82380 RepID=UPI00366C23C7